MSRSHRDRDETNRQGSQWWTSTSDAPTEISIIQWSRVSIRIIRGHAPWHEHFTSREADKTSRWHESTSNNMRNNTQWRPGLKAADGYVLWNKAFSSQRHTPPKCNTPRQACKKKYTIRAMDVHTHITPCGEGLCWNEEPQNRAERPWASLTSGDNILPLVEDSTTHTLVNCHHWYGPVCVCVFFVKHTAASLWLWRREGHGLRRDPFFPLWKKTCCRGCSRRRREFREFQKYLDF